MDVTVLDRQRAHRVSRRGLAAFLSRLTREAPAGGAETLVVCLVSDRSMRRLNREFRQVDDTTDVLAFPAGADESPPGAPRHLGDIVISVAAAARQARDRGHSLARELRILTLHGYLHLLGHDHEADDGDMMRVQRRLERRLLGDRRRAVR